MAMCAREDCSEQTKRSHRAYCSRECFRLSRGYVAKVERTCDAANCTNTTINSRFCSRTCAAVTTNREVVKRTKTRADVRCLNCDQVRPLRSGSAYNDFCAICTQLPEVAAAVIATIKSGTSKDRLYKLGLKSPACEECGITEWRGKPAPLELDHIDGDRSNNHLWNLKILCGNCHRQTSTWGPRNHFARKRAFDPA